MRKVVILIVVPVAIAMTGVILWLIVANGNQEQQFPTLPSLLGRHKYDIRELFGRPDISGPSFSGKDFDTYNAHGVVFDYDGDEKVIKVTATRLRSGTSFKGKIFGIGLGDSLEDCLKEWGESSSTGKRLGYDKVYWFYKGHQLELEIWNQNGADAAFGEYKKDTVKEIVVTREP